MASKAPNLGGHDCDFVQDPPDSLKCLICMLVVNEPWQHGECGRVYCKVCIEEFRKVKNICPNCRQRKPSLFKDGRCECASFKPSRPSLFSAHYKETPVVAAWWAQFKALYSCTGDKDVNALEVRCNNRCHDNADVCEWVGELWDLRQHRSMCPLESIPCPKECQEDGKRVCVARKHLERHLAEECFNRAHACPLCHASGTYLEIVTTHAAECSKMPIHCPNSPCTAVVARSKMEQHKATECQYVVSPCSYADIGCPVELSRSQMKAHKADAEAHLKVSQATIASLRNQVTELRRDLGRLEVAMNSEMKTAVDMVYMMRNGQTTFKVPNFSMYKVSSTEFKCKPFYSTQCGYKLCVIVEANGVAKVKGAYVSVYAHLMKGEFDHTLPWPLVGTVTFELLNQLGNHSHRKKSCSFPADDKDNCRVVDREIAAAGYGCPKFISHSKLGEGSKDCQYLKGDAFYLRVSVEAPDPLEYSWLKCY